MDYYTDDSPRTPTPSPTANKRPTRPLYMRRNPDRFEDQSQSQDQAHPQDRPHKPTRPRRSWRERLLLQSIVSGILLGMALLLNTLGAKPVSTAIDWFKVAIAEDLLPAALATPLNFDAPPPAETSPTPEAEQQQNQDHDQSQSQDQDQAQDRIDEDILNTLQNEMAQDLYNANP